MKIQYYNKIRWGLAPLAPNDAPPLTLLHYQMVMIVTMNESSLFESKVSKGRDLVRYVPFGNLNQLTLE
jgi:hypothetical protein